jgi:hypothetical protein
MILVVVVERREWGWGYWGRIVLGPERRTDEVVLVSCFHDGVCL